MTNLTQTANPKQMSSETLGEYVQQQMTGLLVRLADLKPYVVELWRRFDDGEVIMGCQTRKEFCDQVLHRDPRTVRYMLDGGNHKRQAETVSAPALKPVPDPESQSEENPFTDAEPKVEASAVPIAAAKVKDPKPAGDPEPKLSYVWIVCTHENKKYPRGETTEIHNPAFVSETAAKVYADKLNATYAADAKSVRNEKHATAGYLWVDHTPEPAPPTPDPPPTDPPQPEPVQDGPSELTDEAIGKINPGTYAIRRDCDGAFYKGLRRKENGDVAETADGPEYEAIPGCTRSLGNAHLFCARVADDYRENRYLETLEAASQETSKPSTFSVVDVSGWLLNKDGRPIPPPSQPAPTPQRGPEPLPGVGETIEVAPGYFVEYFESFYSPDEADALIGELFAIEEFEEEVVHDRFHRDVKTKRAVAHFGEGYDYNPTAPEALPWSPLTTSIRERVERVVGPLDHCRVQVYPEGKVGLGWHEDKWNPEIIASLSFGAEREFAFGQGTTTKCKEVWRRPLAHGSLLLIPAKTNEALKHRVPPERRIEEPRINVTFRRFPSLQIPAAKGAA